MFQHAYNGYLDHASDFDELRPLTYVPYRFLLQKITIGSK